MLNVIMGNFVWIYIAHFYKGRIRAIPVKYFLFMFTKKLECLCANLIQWQFTNWQIFLLRAWLLSKIISFLLLSTMNYLCDIHITSISMPHSELWLTKSAGPGLYNIYVSISIIISEISTWYLQYLGSAMCDVNRGRVRGWAVFVRCRPAHGHK